MTKRLFDPSLLRFIHFLTLTQKYLSPSEMALAYSEYTGKSITEKTIRRWIKILQAPEFTYWPIPRCERFGLAPAFVIATMHHTNLAGALPYKMFIAAGFDQKYFTKNYIFTYAIPHNRKAEFEQFWSRSKELGLVKNYDIIYYKGSVVAYAPHHEILNHRGYVEIKNDFDVSRFIKMIHKDMSSELSGGGIEKEIITNPFLVPIILEMQHEYHTSKSLWHAIKARLGRNVWSYIKTGKKRSDGVGVVHVQRALDEINNNFNYYCRQVRAEYEPLYSNENISLFILAKLKDINKLPELTEKIAKRALNTNIRLPLGKDRTVLLYFTTSNKEALHIQSNILPDYLDKDFDMRVFWMNYDESAADVSWKDKSLLKPAYWDLFNPKTCTWKWEQEKYLAELERLAK